MLALLHTSPVHIPVFDALRDRDHPALPLRHLVSEALLTEARAKGPDQVAGEINALLARAVDKGATAVLCTCSTIGAVAEAQGAALGVPVLRVDRPMAAAAVAHGPGPGRRAPHIVVIAALSSTLEPTAALVAEEAARAGRRVEVTAVLAEGAWDRFEEGDRDGYLAAVADAADSWAGADVIVLAQVSMADARHLVTGPVPVLTAPAEGLRAAATVWRTAAGGGARARTGSGHGPG